MKNAAEHMADFLEDESRAHRSERRDTAQLRERLARRAASAPPRHRKPPADTSERERLATFNRPKGELRMSWCEYEGATFVSLRIWEPDESGEGWWPSKTGVTLKRHELEDVAKALIRALDLREEGTRDDD